LPESAYLLDRASISHSGVHDGGPRLRWVAVSGTLLGGACALAIASTGGCAQIVGLTENYRLSYCAALGPQPLFCADFDEGSVGSGWSHVDQTNGALALDTDEFESAPAAVVVHSPAVMAGTVDVAMYRAFSLTGQTFQGSIDLDMRVDRADSNGGVAVLAQVGLEQVGTSYVVQLVAMSQANVLSFTISEVSTAAPLPVMHPVQPTIGLATWTHVTLTVQTPFSGGPATATLSFDGQQVASAPINVPVANFTQTFGVGITYAQTPSTGWTVVFDDVIFNATAN